MKHLPLLILCMLMFFSCKKNPVPLTPSPTVSSISPSSGTAGTVVNISGSNFSATASDNTVEFNGVPATINSANATLLTVVAPTGGTTGKITVATPGGTATGPIFTYTSLLVPSITSISPDSAAAGSTVTITGTNFKTNVADNTVKFNGVAATVTSASGTQLKVTVPSTGTSGNVTATTSDGTSNSFLFTYITTPDVYVVGTVNTNNVTLWKNGIATTLGRGVGTSVYLNGSDVYVAGGSDDNGKAQCWKNGIALNLTSGTGNSFAQSVVVSGTDVYVAGHQINPQNSIATATVWKNGTPTSLTDANTNSDVSLTAGNPIFISGTDVYVAGYYLNANLQETGCVWKNGILNTLSSTSLQYVAISVAVSGSDVYAVGYGYFGNQRQAIYWKNGVISYITDGTQYAQANCVMVNGSDVYIAYFEGNEGGTITKILKNGTLVSTITNLAQPDAMYVTSNGDIYLTGVTNDHFNAYYFKNGAMLEIPNSTSYSSGAAGIFVQ